MLEQPLFFTGSSSIQSFKSPPFPKNSQSGHQSFLGEQRVSLECASAHICSLLSKYFQKFLPQNYFLKKYILKILQKITLSKNIFSKFFHLKLLPQEFFLKHCSLNKCILKITPWKIHFHCCFFEKINLISCIFKLSLICLIAFFSVYLHFLKKHLRVIISIFPVSRI